ncbi:hypothetical protein MC7420_4122 [Coleofasciculus chthonoplastes PCC 7420]|uniref:Uncharacterized protein n=1 Tax=Coleofasciculus chthonoplastes PCC 7420 TaxID=118168 RepID=B4VVE2_9CYAN|nr:hypothetical protein MC7420_4122 [Coleofasciculus chthonoplastes PCC 7420]
METETRRSPLPLIVKPSFLWASHPVDSPSSHLGDNLSL